MENTGAAVMRRSRSASRALSHKGRAFRLGRRKFSQLHLTGGAAHRVKAGADPLVQPLLGIGLENQGRPAAVPPGKLSRPAEVVVHLVK